MWVGTVTIVYQQTEHGDMLNETLTTWDGDYTAVEEVISNHVADAPIKGFIRNVIVSIYREDKVL